MSHIHTTFIYEGYAFDLATATATFRYSFDGSRRFNERVVFKDIASDYSPEALDAALFLSFLLVGMSYYKLFPVKKVDFPQGGLDARSAAFLNKVYCDGFSQFLYENHLLPDDLPTFEATTHVPNRGAHAYDGSGVLALQSGGKDSLLTAAMLEKQGIAYTPWYMQYGDSYPEVLDMLASTPRTIRRHLDRQALQTAMQEGGLSGHVPITYMVMSFAIIDAILHKENTILVSIGTEGEEPHEHIGELAVNHQWSKTWAAEKLFANYVHESISADILIGSPLRSLTELRIVQLFSELAWPKFGHDFSSCNLANYKQGADNRKLRWDGTCSKCANAFLLLAPFIEPHELAAVIGGNLFAKPELVETFKGLLGIDNVMKPFECVGETGELRFAYHWARSVWGTACYQLPFEVPESNFDFMHQSAHQLWTEQFFGQM